MAAAVTVLAGVLSLVLQQAPGSPPGVPSPHVRPLTREAAALLRHGKANSPTFERLFDQLERSDVIVLVRTGTLTEHSHIGVLATTPGARYLLIDLRGPDLRDRLIAALGHELHHAVEIASVPGVRSQAALLALFRTRGHSTAGSSLCSSGAQEASARIATELAFRRPRLPGGMP